MRRFQPASVTPRREFFTKVALLGGFAALGSSRSAKAHSVGNITTQDMTRDNGMPAVLAYPVGGQNLPTIILMHERYRLVRRTRDGDALCARWLRRVGDQPALNAGSARYDLSDPEAMELIKGGVRTLTKHAAADLS
jgi:hypothetical protein